MRLFGRRHSQRLVPAGTDEVLVSFPLPAGGVLNNIHLETHVIGPETVEFLQAVMYGLSGFVVPVLDPDDQIVVNTLWDNLIPKDVDHAAGVFDIDTSAADATPEFEMGEPDWTGVMDLAAMNPVQIFRRRKMITVATSMANYATVSAAPDLWTPTDIIKSKIGRKVRVATPSMVMLGFSSPSLDETTTGETNTPEEAQWTLLQYLEITLEQAFINLIGNIEAGAESPWEDASGFIAGLIEDDAFEETAGSFAPVSWVVFTGATFDISVPGRRNQNVISSEGG